MAGKFSNRKKLIMLSAAIMENMSYIKESDDLFPQSEMEGKKYGMAVHGYLPDAGSVSQGLVAHPDKAHQVEVTAWLDNYNTAAETDMWDEIENIEDFKKEMVDKRAKKLAREVQIAIIRQNVYRSAQAVVTTAGNLGYDLLGDASSALDELSIVGERVDFQTPKTFSKIGRTGANLFLPSDIQKEIYEEASLGVYNDAACVKLPGLPILNTTGMAASITVAGTVKKDASNNILGVSQITTCTGVSGDVIPGVPYTVDGLKVVDEGGVETEQAYVVIPVSEVYYDEDGARQTRTVIPGLRISATGKGWGNPNAHMAAATISSATAGTTTTLTLTPLSGITAGKHYQVGQVRNKKALSFSGQKFKNLPAAKQENVGVFENVSLKMQSAPEILNGISYFRIDMPFVARIFDHRQSVTTYIQLD